MNGLTGTWLGIPELTWIALALALIAGVALSVTQTGRAIYAVGSNPAAARLQGLSVRRITVLVFVLSGMLAGLSGILFLGQFGFADFSAATGYELTTVAIVVIGGASIFGGEGTILGTVLGCLLVGSRHQRPGRDRSLGLLAGCPDRGADRQCRVYRCVSAAPLRRRGPMTRVGESVGRAGHQLVLAGLIVFVLILTANEAPYFFTAANLSTLASNSLELALMALPVTVLIIAGRSTCRSLRWPGSSPWSSESSARAAYRSPWESCSRCSPALCSEP